MNAPELGAIATSRAGHDKAQTFVIVGRDGDEYALLCDGASRPVEKPKRKKLKHLRVEPHVAEEIREHLLAGETLQNAQVRKALIALGYHKEPGK